MFDRDIKLKGVQFEDAQKNIKIYGCKDIGSFALVREPDNPHDPNAIRVEIAGNYLGYIPKATAKKLAPLMDSGESFLAMFIKRNESPVHEIVGLTVRIVRYPIQMAA